MVRCAISRFHLGRSKVKVIQAGQVVPRQPTSSTLFLSPHSQCHFSLEIVFFDDLYLAPERQNCEIIQIETTCR